MQSLKRTRISYLEQYNLKILKEVLLILNRTPVPVVTDFILLIVVIHDVWCVAVLIYVKELVLAKQTAMFKTNKVIVTWIFVNWFYCFVNGHSVDLFSAKDRHGNAIRIDVSDRDCTNVPEPWIGRIVSVDTMGNCMQFYENSFCRGSLTVLQPFHVLHQMDLSLINFANVVQSVSPCGPKVSEGRYVIQNAADASILTVVKNREGFSTVSTKPPDKVIQKFQQWDVSEKALSEFTLKPREHEDNYPVSFDENSLKKGKIVRKRWQFLSVGRGRYIIKSLTSKNCLYKTEEQKVEENPCRIFSPNQEWVLRSILTPNPTKPTKSNAPVGPGLNLNILSKVSQYRPNAKPKPELIPIFLNSSIAHQIGRPSSISPYQIRKKIKRGPRPQSQMQDLALGLRPPGLRPALPSRISNNNDYLLLKLPSSQVAKRPLVIPHSLPKDKEIVESGEDKEEESDEKEGVEEDEDEEEDDGGSQGSSSSIEPFRTSRENSYSRPLLEIVRDDYPKVNSIEMNNIIAKYRKLRNPYQTQIHHNIFTSSNTNANSNVKSHGHNGQYENKFKKDITPASHSSQVSDSKEDSESFMQVFMKKVKEKMSSVGSRWTRKKQHNTKSATKQPRDDFESFMADIE